MTDGKTDETLTGGAGDDTLILGGEDDTVNGGYPGLATGAAQAAADAKARPSRLARFRPTKAGVKRWLGRLIILLLIVGTAAAGLYYKNTGQYPWNAGKEAAVTTAATTESDYTVTQSAKVPSCAGTTGLVLVVGALNAEGNTPSFACLDGQQTNLGKRLTAYKPKYGEQIFKVQGQKSLDLPADRVGYYIINFTE